MTTNEVLEFHALILMSNLPPSWETFVTTVRNASSTSMTYASGTGSIFPKSPDGEPLFRQCQVNFMLYKIWVNDNTYTEAPLEVQGTHRVGANPGTREHAIVVRSLETSKQNIVPSRLRMRRLRVLSTMETIPTR